MLDERRCFLLLCFFFAFFISWFASVRSPSVGVPFCRPFIPLLFNFFLWLWKLALEKGKPMIMLVLSGGPSLFCLFFFLFSFVHFGCVLGTKAKLGMLAFCSFLFFMCIILRSHFFLRFKNVFKKN